MEKGGIFNWRYLFIPIAINSVALVSRDILNPGAYTYKCLYIFGVRLAYWNTTFSRR